MSDNVLEALLRRDRAVVIAALAVLAVLAWADLVWLADDMKMGGMDMSGFRAIPAGQSLMLPASAPWQPVEFAYVFAMWVAMMIGMMTPSVAPMILIYAGRLASSGAGQAVCAEQLVRRWLSRRLDGVRGLRHFGAMGARARRAADADDGERQQCARRKRADPGRPLSMDAAQGGLPVPLPRTARLHPTAGRLSPRCLGRARRGLSTRPAALAILVLVEKLAPFGWMIARGAGVVFVAAGLWLLTHAA